MKPLVDHASSGEIIRICLCGQLPRINPSNNLRTCGSPSPAASTTATEKVGCSHAHFFVLGVCQVMLVLAKSKFRSFVWAAHGQYGFGCFQFSPLNLR